MELQSNNVPFEGVAHKIQIIETERLRLRPPEPEDREGVWSAAHHKSNITKGMLWDPPESLEQIDEWTKNSAEGWKRGDSFTWTVEAKENGEFAGRVVLRKQADKDAVWYIGFWIHPFHQGKGYVTEAAKAVVDAAFEHMGIKAIISSHADWNTGSGKVLMKIGMTHTGHNPAGFKKHGKDIPEKEYELTRGEWMKQKQ